MTGDEYLKAKLAETAWRCRRGGGIMAMMAVAFVIRNRVNGLKEPWLTACGVSSGDAACDLAYDKTNPDTRDPEFVQILHAVDGIFDGRLQDTLTNGATTIYLANRAQIPATLERVAVVGQLILCK